ncbi:DUF6399 domain-containing protein [Candidatus Accumulibacter aalborgensis]|uniref:DUF6399 domain-containing protein n=1 Tax=Candidatus Accumulibacter aalborgensis TaxID=1860102 RepID=UPI001C90F432|nr:DUF6399 domain-containing protein [Candidatus Accumulibacter aalborgensis]
MPSDSNLHWQRSRRQCDRTRQLLEPLRHGAHPLHALPPAERARLEQVVGDCADRFQRSGSGVEGRSGQPALRHRDRHLLTS